MILLNQHNFIYSRCLLPVIKQSLKVAIANEFDIPSIDKIMILNRFFEKLKKENIFQKLDGFWLSAYNDLALLNFTRINLVRPNATPANIGLSLNYNNQGWKGTGVSSSDFNTLYDYNSQNINYKLGDSNVTAVVSNASGVTNGASSIISSGQTNGVESFYAFNTVGQRQNSLANLSSSVDMSGTGFKSFSKINTNCVLVNKNIQSFRTQSNTNLAPLQLVLLRMSTTAYSQLGLSMFSIGGNMVGLESTYRQIINEYLTEIGLTAFA